MKKVVIIGGVAGGASCAARLRRLDKDVEIVLLERGQYISYANCGLPYHVGDVIKSRDALLLQTPEIMKAKFNIDVRVMNEVISIDREDKRLTVKDSNGNEYEESYDKLIISTGSSPLRPPIPGIDSPKIKTLWTVPDTDEIRVLTHSSDVKSAAIIGGGFIGLEMAENLHEAGLKVSIVEMLPQVMAPLDFEMAQMLHETISQSGVELHLGDGVSSFEDTGSSVKINLSSGASLNADLVILSIGVRPNSELAKAAGLEINQRSGIVTDEKMMTSDPDIFAIGDVSEVNDFVFGDKTMIPLAGPANKQGRIAANILAGLDDSYSGSQGTSVAKIFDLTAASTGANEKVLQKRGLQKGKDYDTLIITQNSHAGYYPGAVPLTVKVIFDKVSGKLFGAQIVGYDGVDKRIDTIATTLRLGGSVYDLSRLELAYAPPYSSAKDPVNMAGFVAENIKTGLMRFAPWDVAENGFEGDNSNVLLLDVREAEEVIAVPLENSVNIPLGTLRNRLNELDRDKSIVVFCAIGVRGYNGARILMQNGFKNVSVYPGGMRFYVSTHYTDFENSARPEARDEMAKPGELPKDIPLEAVKLDCSGLQCPGPIMKVFEKVKSMPDGGIIEVHASDPGFLKDISAWCRRTGNTLVSTRKTPGDYVALVKKGVEDSAASYGDATSKLAAAQNDGKTIIVFSGDLDKVLASFIIANGAAAMGRPVTMFFTFWGLNALRKPDKQKVEKTFIESMFGSMLPRGSKKLKLSKMNMGGMGTSMMKKIMRDKNIDSLEDLIKKAMSHGVKIVACTMSMDVMGIKQEELIDGVELGGVGAYLGDAEESNVNLFI